MLRKICWIGSATIALCGLASAPVNAQFFFLIPLPKGSANPDTIDANLNQRQNAMCAAYHERAIDPLLSGKRENTWRGEIAKTAAERMKAFQPFNDLKNRYARQWQLQAKNSYQAGVEYSRNLLSACNEADLPYDKSQYDNWKVILQLYPNSTSILKMVHPAQAKSSEHWLDGINWFSVTPPKNLKSTMLEVLVETSGKPSSCVVKTTSGAPQLDTLACEAVTKNGAFTPPIDGFSIRSDYIDYEFNWPAFYQARWPAQPKLVVKQSEAPIVKPDQISVGTASPDQDLDKAVNRCKIIGHLPRSAEFKRCVSEQLRLLAR